MDAVLAAAGVDVHVAALVVAAEDAGERALKGTTALLKMLFEVGMASRGMIGLA